MTRPENDARLSASPARAVRRMPPHPHATTIGWMLPPVAALALLALWKRNGLVNAPDSDLLRAQVTLALCVLAAASRHPLFSLVERLATVRPWLPSVARFVRDAALLALAIACATVALEFTWNAQAAEVSREFVEMEVRVIGVALLSLYFLGQRRGWAPALGVAALGLCGLAQYFVALFRGTAILPADVLAFGTALSVAGGYAYELDANALHGLTTALVGIAACSLMGSRRLGWFATTWARARQALAMQASGGRTRPRDGACTRATNRPSPLATLGRLATNLACAALCLSTLWSATVGADYATRLGAHVDAWSPLVSYARQGLLTSFLTSLQHMRIPMPNGYSPEGADELAETLATSYDGTATPGSSEASAQFADQRPSVVVVMNETFSDLSFMDGLGVGYEGPAAFGAVDDALVRGKLGVSAYGGGTCNSEFEFLTGNSLAHIGSGTYPYMSYNLSNVASLPRQFSSLGYDTTAIHPNLASNWRRDEVYPTLGFDRFLSIDDFAGAETFHSGVTDAATYEAVLERLRTQEAPQFIFDVTMQNHSAYDQANIDASLLRGYQTGYLDEAGDAVLNEYLACIDASDRDLAWFMGELRGLDRPVVLVFFGDHQPNFSSAINDILYPNEDEPAHGARTYLTDYLVWANYDVAGSEGMRVEDASASTLAAVALEAVGAPLTQVQKALLATRGDLPLRNLFAYRDADGAWHDSLIDRAPSAAALAGTVGGTSGEGAAGEAAATGGAEQPSAPDADEPEDTAAANGPGSPGALGADEPDAATRAKTAFDALAKIQYHTFAERV